MKERKSNRVALNELQEACLSLNDQYYLNPAIKDLSKGGFFTEGSYQGHIGDECLLVVKVAPYGPGTILKMHSKIVRTNEQGIALEFIEPDKDQDSQILLDLLVLNHSDEPLKAVSEFHAPPLSVAASAAMSDIEH